jgi:3',5'-cyclic AMP phosphodiesterase CpdA
MRIAIVTDSHLAPIAEELLPNWDAAKRFVSRSAVDLTIHLGDITLDGATRSADLRYARAVVDDWPTRIRFLPGNHDIGDNPWAPGLTNPHLLDPERLREYRALFGPDYWAMQADGWWVLGLNAQLFGTAVEQETEQWKWLGDFVAEAAKRPVVVMLHKPLFQDGPQDDVPHVRYVPFEPRQRLLNLMASLDVRVVLSGHTHQYRSRRIGEIEHVWVPSTAFVFPDEMQERLGVKLVGIGLLELSPDIHRFDLVCAAGMEQRDATDSPAILRDGDSGSS